MARRKLIRMAAALVLAGGILLAISAWMVGGALIASSNRRVALAPDFPVVESMIDSESGANLATWYAAQTDAEATIILLHGLRANRESMLDRARLFWSAGYAIVMLDLQAHGESLGDHITLGHLERHDVRAAVAYAKKLNPHHKIGVIGCSLGGAAALLGSPLGVDAMVIESVFPTVTDAVYDRVSAQVGPLSHLLSPLLLCQLRPRLGISPAELCPINKIDEAECPILIASGELDQHTTLAETNRMYESAQSPKQLVIFGGAAHVDLLSHNPQTYESEIVSFLNIHLRANGPIESSSLSGP